MITELISVGTEILLGNIVNTNSAYLSEKCALLGLSVYYQDVVGDNEGRMRDVIRTALDRSDVVILTGGLGPTEDDITMLEFARYYEIPVAVVATKTDKLPSTKLKNQLKMIRKELQLNDHEPLFPFSAEKKTGMEAVWEYLIPIFES